MKIIFRIFKSPYLSGKLPGRLMIAYQVEMPPSEENIDPCLFYGIKKISFYFLMFMFNAKDCKFNQQWVTFY